MLVLVHDYNSVVKVLDLNSNTPLAIVASKPMQALLELAEQFPERILIWCHKHVEKELNTKGITEAFLLKNTMLSFCNTPYLPEDIGYVEDSPFLKVNKTVTYPTWLMSSLVGAIYGSQLIKFKNIISLKNSFDYNLNSIAKLGMPNGLFCYSEPKLLKTNAINPVEKASKTETFKFVKQHYKNVWSVLLLVNYIIYDGKFPILPFLKTVFYKQKQTNLTFNLQSLQPIPIKKKTIDVIIPTLGRKDYLHQVLKDLATQTLLPEQVIVIEQNDEVGSQTELDFITTQTWPFKIIHQFIHQTGACNARNLALDKVTSEYVFLADDDIEFENTLLEDASQFMELNNINAATLSCLNKNEKEKHTQIFQWSSFGSGCSIVASNYLKTLRFNMALEFGYGEDADFGMQLRNLGADVIYLPQLKVVHLRAPIGGFRTRFVHPWENDEVLPKPSPTVMLNRKSNTTKQQVLGYKTRLCLQYYKVQNIINPFRYLKQFKKQWMQSEHWCKVIEKQ